MSKLSLDIETFSECDLKKCGVYRYAEDPSTELLCAVFAFDDEAPQLWVPHALPGALKLRIETHVAGLGGKVHYDRTCPGDLRIHIECGGLVSVHNYQFERTVLNGVAGRKVGFPKMTIDQGRCTAAKCAVHGLPRALGDAAKILGTHPKDDAGRTDMLALSKPRTGKDPRWTPENAPDRFFNLYTYCIDDVLAERGLDHVVPDLTPAEQKNYQLDQRINDRGVRIDLPAIAHVQRLIDRYKEYLQGVVKTRTGFDPTQTGKLAEWIRAHGYPQLENLQAETVRQAVKDEACPDEVKTVLKAYSTYAMKAVSKYESMVRAACKDGRLRGMFLFYGAGTGRWSALIVQLQNLFRPVIDDPDTAIEAFAAEDLEWIKWLYEGTDPMKVFASCVRGMIIPSEGNDLLFPDFASIESRFCTWLWGEEWKLAAFRAFDAGTGPDLYKLAFARTFRVAVDSVTKAQRQIGKVLELALQYEGGVGAIVTMADAYGVNLEELADMVWPSIPHDVMEQAEWAWGKYDGALPKRTFLALDSVKQMWRRAHPRIVAGWKQLSEAAKLAIQNPGKNYATPNKKIMFSFRKQWLCMRLPSGRVLYYFRPSIDDSDTIRYWGVDTYTRRYLRTATYGGKLNENAVQAGSRDVLVPSMFALEEEGYIPIGSVHDEPITEVPEGFGSVEHACKIMCRELSWAPGLPIAAEGQRAKRYGK